MPRTKTDEEKWQEFMDGSFNPLYTPEEASRADLRVAVALEYIAYQIGEIRRDVARIRRHMKERR